MNERWEKFGKYFGFPRCCRKAFMRSKKELHSREKAGQLGGVGTGFIPCAWHARLILAGKVRLQDIIRNRACPTPFPYDELYTQVDAERILKSISKKKRPIRT